MNKTIVIIIAVLVVGGGAYYLLAQNGSSTVPEQTPSPAATAPETSTVTTSSTTTTTTSVSPSTATISIQNFSFNPSTLAVKAGTKVTWTNNDTVPHTVTSDSAGLFDSKAIAPGQSFSFTFTTPGTVSYHCAIHSMMKGTVNVEN